ncbi:hypothetical protein CQA57_07640 [Helicobacter anseris]|uniref:Mce/MlaD domain-containing protein n=1 Tax=Helicobacter anseris TaxID=375926 RepID=A0A3D8J229_9HELI|nr:MlaD family protein [Helicobacter anseris]RDU71599.1 hypothetical protein CQA57_07640 [Helicobacter anseris]
MERRINFLFIGIIFFSILSALVLFIIIMGRFSFDDKEYRYYRIYTENEISGLGINTPVRYKGITIGSISHIGFDKDRLGVVKIIVKIKKIIPVRKNSTLAVDSQGLAGMSYLALKQSKENDFITDEKDATLNFEPNIFGKLTSKASEVSDEVSVLLKSLKILFSENNMKNISDTLESINVLSKNLKDMQLEITNITNNTNALVKSLNEQVQNGDFNAKEILNPFLMRLDTSLNYMDQFFKRGGNILDKFERDPYNTIFGEQKK